MNLNQLAEAVAAEAANLWNNEARTIAGAAALMTKTGQSHVAEAVAVEAKRRALQAAK